MTLRIKLEKSNFIQNYYPMNHFLFAATVFMLVGCGKTSDKAGHHDHGDSDSVAQNANRALYDQVQDIHDEVMPKMEDLYNLKKELQEEIARTPGMVTKRKKELEDMISNLDSASKAMMDWMHHFNPLPDSVDQEKAREYLETEMEGIKKVRDLTNETLGKAKSMAGKK